MGGGHATGENFLGSPSGRIEDFSCVGRIGFPLVAQSWTGSALPPVVNLSLVGWGGVIVEEMAWVRKKFSEGY